MPDSKALDPLTKIVANAYENRDVRIAAADALRNYRDMNAYRALIHVLNGKDFGVAWQARKSLVLLSGRDMSYNEAAWLGYLTSSSKPLG